ncbi:F-box only protein 41-like [Aplochiton taeniatus]
MSLTSDLPYFCPRCGDRARFATVPELRSHLVSRHTYDTLLVLSQARARSSRPGTLLPLAGPLQAQKQSSSLGLELQGLPLPLACLDLASSTASAHLLGEMFGRSHWKLTGDPIDPCTALALPSGLQPSLGNSLTQVGVQELGRLELGGGLGLEFGLCPGERLLTGALGLEERLGLGLDQRIARTFAEVEERVARRVGRLKEELRRREAELEEERRDGERIGREKQEVEERAAYLARQVSISVKMMDRLRDDLEGKEKELEQRQQEMVEIESFLRDTAEREAGAKSRLQVFIESLLDRADRAERQLSLITSRHHGYTRTDPYTHYQAGQHTHTHSLDGGEDNVFSGTIGNRRSYSVSGSYRLGEQLYSQHEGPPGGRLRTLSLGSGGWESTSSLCSTPSRRHGDRALRADTLRLRAGLFCVFPYLDVRSLLLAAEVCSDWRFVARHPAVWTRLRLDSARVSAKFLSTLSQWCTQTNCLVLQNLKPRAKDREETREDYHKSTRGCLESGLEALLRSAGGSLQLLKVYNCPHTLTDRSLWLASCYCRNLHTLIYRSQSDPLGHEVVWALGAGCRNITTLQVAPLHPCQQPTRFSNRCLQTIGRCWPHLHRLSVGGAGCGTQGLVAVVRSCVDLQVLELERIADLGQEVAVELCREGLKSLETLLLTHSAVTGKAILHFHSVCVNLRSIEVQVGAADYFEDPDTLESQKQFEDMVSTLQALQKLPELCDILLVKTEDFC